MAESEPSKQGGAPSAAGATAAPEAPPKDPPAPILKLVDKIEDAVLDGAVAKVKWKVKVPPVTAGEIDRSEYEYIAVARVPSLDIMKQGPSALLVKQVIRRAVWTCGTKGDLGPAAEGGAGEPPGLAVKIHVSPKDPNRHTAKVTLKSDDGVFKAEKTGADGTPDGTGMLVTFTHLLPARRYTATLERPGLPPETVVKSKIVGEAKIAGPHVHIGEPLKLKAEIAGDVKAGTAAKFKVFEKEKLPDDEPVKELPGKVDAQHLAVVDWKFEPRKGMDDIDNGPTAKVLETRAKKEAAGKREADLRAIQTGAEQRKRYLEGLKARARTIVSRREDVLKDAEAKEKDAEKKKSDAEQAAGKVKEKKKELEQKRGTSFKKWQDAEAKASQKRVEREKSDALVADKELHRLGAEARVLRAGPSKHAAMVHLAGRYPVLNQVEPWVARTKTERDVAEKEARAKGERRDRICDALRKVEQDLAKAEEAAARKRTERDEAERKEIAATGAFDQAESKRALAVAAREKYDGMAVRARGRFEVARFQLDAKRVAKVEAEAALARACDDDARNDAQKALDLASFDVEDAEEVLKKAKAEADETAAERASAEKAANEALAARNKAAVEQREARGAKVRAQAELFGQEDAAAIARQAEGRLKGDLVIAAAQCVDTDAQAIRAKAANLEAEAALAKAKRDVDDAKKRVEACQKEEDEARKENDEARKQKDDAVKARAQAWKDSQSAADEAAKAKVDLRTTDGDWYRTLEEEQRADWAAYSCRKTFTGVDYLYRKAKKEKDEADAELRNLEASEKAASDALEKAKKEYGEAKKALDDASKEYDEAKKKLEEYEHERATRHYVFPEYYFTVEVLGEVARSSTMSIVDKVDQTLVDEHGKPHPDTRLAFRFIDNTCREVATKADGKFILDPVPPGDYEVNVTGRYLFIKPPEGVKMMPVEAFPDEPPPVPEKTDGVAALKSGSKAK